MIYVSEIMLQQTQVKTVLDRYYFPFLEAFPTLDALASASREDVLRQWQGLGYYNRAAHLHETARRCASGLPDSVDALMALPGIGRNTAHAVAAFAFGAAVPVMEANVRRVLARIFALAQPSEAELWARADSLLDQSNPYDYNQAMMDLGALVCVRRNPKCGQCPASALCKGKASPEAYPLTKKKEAAPVRRRNIAIFRNAAGAYYASPRKGRFLKGLYHFIETDEKDRFVHFAGIDYRFSGHRPLGSIRQQYSHFTLEADVWLFAARSGTGKSGWYSLDDLKNLPISMAERKAIALLPAGIAKASKIKRRQPESGCM